MILETKKKKYKRITSKHALINVSIECEKQSRSKLTIIDTTSLSRDGGLGSILIIVVPKETIKIEETYLT